MSELSARDSTAVALVSAIRAGDLESLRGLLSGTRGLASASIVDGKGCRRTPLHIATDWPGYFPNAPTAIRLLLEAGADPNVPFGGGTHRETPLHWAASTDDVEVARVLIDGGANLEATGASIAGGTPLDDAVAYGCWQVARLLAARGARVDKLWHAAALGLLERMEQLLDSDPAPDAIAINDAFWQACHGGQRRAAELLLARGADPNWIPDHSKASPREIAAGPDTARQSLIAWLDSLPKE